jgi:hypothetical protein
VDEAIRAVDERHWYQDVELKSQPSGRALLEATPNEARRYVRAAAVQSAHWDRVADQVRSKAKTHAERVNLHQRPDWQQVSVRRHRAATVISTLMRRALPFEEEDLLALLDWCNGAQQLSMYGVPVGHIARALQRFLETHALSDALRERVARFAADLRASYDKDANRYATTVEQLLAGPAATSDSVEPAEPNDSLPTAPSPPPAAAPAGNPAVLDAVKRHLGVAAEAVTTETLPPDGFPLRADSAFRAEHALLSEIL